MKYLTCVIVMLLHVILINAVICAEVPIQPITEIRNSKVIVRAIQSNSTYIGFDVISNKQSAAGIRFSSNRIITASKCMKLSDGKKLTFTGLMPKSGTGFGLGKQDVISITLRDDDPYPLFSFDLHIAAFDQAKWLKTVGKQPFHFMTMYMPDAEVWHQCGWLNETPVADPFPLLLDTHVGSPEISAYLYNRNWSYTVPLGGHPVPVIGLWAPKSKHYAAFEFQSTRLDDNSEKDIATGYCWGSGKSEVRKPNNEQFVSLVYPFGGTGYQSLVFPKPGARINSHGVLLWSLDLPSTNDPNRFFYTYVWDRYMQSLPNAPAVNDLSWLPKDARLQDFSEPGSDGILIRGVEGDFQVPGSKQIVAWHSYNESAIAVAKARGDVPLLSAVEVEAKQLLAYAKHQVINGDDCVYWEKPLEGRWTDAWGGEPVKTIHNSDSFAAGRLLLGMYRYLGKSEYLPVVDGVFNWAKHIAWTRNEFADVPSSPFAIGATLSVSFCLDYYMAFKDSADEHHRNEALRALDLAKTFMYRHMSIWVSDNNRADNLDSTFFWEPTSGRDWTGGACSNEVSMVLNMLVSTAVHTGDPLMIWALQGSLDKFPILYQEVYKDSISDYTSTDFSEAYGLYTGNNWGVGGRAPFGGFFKLNMIEPVGSSITRVTAGERAAMVFNNRVSHTSIRDYRYAPDGNLSFTLSSSRSGFDLSLTVPYVDISAKQVAVVHDGKTVLLHLGTDYIRPTQALWSILIKNLNDGDHIVIGTPDENSPILPSTTPITRKPVSTPSLPKWSEPIDLSYDATPNADWNKLDSWVGAPSGLMWTWGIPFMLSENTGKCVLTKPAGFKKPVNGKITIAVLYSAGDGPVPSIVYSDGTKIQVNTDMEALAWRAWPPSYSAKLLAAPAITNGKTVTGIDPGSRSVWALTAMNSASTSEDQVMSALKKGAAMWKETSEKDRMVMQLAEDASTLPDGVVAILPPRYSGPASDIMQRIGLLRKSVYLTPERLVDSSFFNAQRFKVVVYAAGEDYLDTVVNPGDAADAVVRYVKGGGTLVVVSPNATLPFFYANGPGFRRGGSLGERLGLPIGFSIESKLPEKLRFISSPGQNALTGIPAQMPYPTGDIRLRAVEPSRLIPGSGYTPVYSVIGESGKSYGDAAALIQLPNGQGRILYVYGSLMSDKANGQSIALAAVRFIINAAR
ncbi:MAG: hypothetical protein ACYC0V_18240 [Armatimonadota bacterium]